jgi:hypothetical protein
MHGMHKREIESSFDKRWEEIKKKLNQLSLLLFTKTQIIVN